MYDADDRPVVEKWIPVGGGSPTNTITHTYDAAGRLTGIVDSNSQYAYTYDDADRLLAVDDAGPPGLPQVTLTYGYDDAGNRTSLDDSLGGLTSYSYDVRDDLTSITQSGSGVTAKRADYEYDAAMRLTTLTRFSDLSGSTVVLKTRYSYDSADRLTTLSHQTSGGTVRVEYGYALDAANRLTGESRTWGSGASSDTLSYAYTNDGQLTSASHSNTSFADETFGYDANGNRNTSGYSTATGNRASTDGVYNYAYDDEGNTTSKTEIATGDQTSYSWDHRNRLTEVDRKVGATTTVLATFTYDALDRRIGEKAGSSVRWTLFDGYSPALDFNGSGTQVARYLQGLDGVLARETSGGVAWYLPDRLGTVRDLADALGSIIDHVDYGAFGELVAETAPSSGDRFVGFAGLERDSATGLNLAIYRAQDPITGRWSSEDPIGFSGVDSNLSRYVANNPPNAVDPDGLLGKSPYNKPIPGFPSLPDSGLTPMFPGGQHRYPLPNKPSNPANAIFIIGPPNGSPAEPENGDTYGNKGAYLKALGVPAENVFYINGSGNLAPIFKDASKLKLKKPELFFWGHGRPGSIMIGNSKQPGYVGPKESINGDDVGVFGGLISSLDASRVTILSCNVVGRPPKPPGLVGPPHLRGWSFVQGLRRSAGVPTSALVGFEAPYLFEGKWSWYLQVGGFVYTIKSLSRKPLKPPPVSGSGTRARRPRAVVGGASIGSSPI